MQGQIGVRTPSGCFTTWCVSGVEHLSIYPTYAIENIPTTSVLYWKLLDLNESIWRNSKGYERAVMVDATDSIQWLEGSSLWSDPININTLPGSGALQTQANYRIGNNLIQSVWRDNEGYFRYVAIVNDVIQWNSAPEWSGPVALNSLPGSGSIQAHGDFVAGNTLWQAHWRNNEGYARSVPIVNNSPQWSSASSWNGPISINTLPESGSIQAQDNFVVNDTVWQVIWRNNKQHSRSAPIVNGAVDWNQASSWTETTAQESLPGSGTVQTQANYIFP